MLEDSVSARPGSWWVLIVMMALAYAVSKWATRMSMHIVMPLGYFIRFIGYHYETDINRLGEWLKALFKRRTHDRI